ncbi:MAG: PHP domain-containing protein [Solobacterium sp.]|nr:PHP domain-containing protein [Solobacterium sp.]
MFYDLHMHSCLSPCAEDAMTPNNICNMAFIKGLDLIAVTDHNSTKNLPAVAEVAKAIGLKMLYGAELETSEEVHVLGLFNKLEKALKFQEWIDSKMPNVKNDEDFFGHQWIMNSQDEKIGDEERLLLVSLSATLEETAAAIHEYGGRVILAHVLDRANSVTHQLGFIPMDLAYDGLEVKNEEQRLRVISTNPWITEDSTNWFIDSDAHYLTDISEPDHFLRASVYQKLWGDDV